MINDTISTRHGGDIYSRPVRLDFSASINPLGMPESARNALIGSVETFEHYPDPACGKLRECIARHDGFPAPNIVCGNGAADLIYRIVQTVRPQQALVTAPTFSEYERALRAAGCEVTRYITRKEDGFRPREDFTQSVKGCDLIFLCNPGNPSGTLISRKLLAEIICSCADAGVLLVIDECFFGFTGEIPLTYDDVTDSVILLRAFTKIYAMAGLRLGYALCHDRRIAHALLECGQCWSVSVPAQTAGAAALGEPEYLSRTVGFIRREREFLTASLREFGFEVFDASANFILFRCGVPLDGMLMREGIAIRSCRDFPGLEEGYFRIGVRTREENRMLIEAIGRCLKNG